MRNSSASISSYNLKLEVWKRQELWQQIWDEQEDKPVINQSKQQSSEYKSCWREETIFGKEKTTIAYTPSSFQSQREDKMDGYPKLMSCCGSCNKAVTNVVKNCREDEEEEDVHSTVSKLLDIWSANRQNLQQQQYTHESINPSELAWSENCVDCQHWSKVQQSVGSAQSTSECTTWVLDHRITSSSQCQSGWRSLLRQYFQATQSRNVPLHHQLKKASSYILHGTSRHPILLKHFAFAWAALETRERELLPPHSWTTVHYIR